MHIHILGIGGTFMGGIAAIAQQMGYRVSGCDRALYPPMSTQLTSLGIECIEGYEASQIKLNPDLWLIGNSISRGNPLFEALLESSRLYQSAPQWLYENVLRYRHVIAVAGTHGKTTTTAMVAFILDQISLNPTQYNISDSSITGQCGYLIGGVAQNFPSSARLGNNRYFVIEADEYDTALFDKRSKFIHYHPRTLILNNLEFDHADIFSDLSAIETQFHHLVRTLPASAYMIANRESTALENVLERGCFSQLQWFNDKHDWHWKRSNNADHVFDIFQSKKHLAVMPPNIIGSLYRSNALAAIAATSHVINISAAPITAALAQFKGVKRRLELHRTVTLDHDALPLQIFDDFAHHPTAICATLSALREKFPQRPSNTINSYRIIAVIEPRSNTMKMGVFRKKLCNSLQEADQVFGYSKQLNWDLAETLKPIGGKVYDHIDHLVEGVATTCQPGDIIVGMSNGSFDDFYAKLVQRLAPVSSSV